MSLDVYLTMPNEADRLPQIKGSGIFIRENGSTKEISREEWGKRYPDREPHVVTDRGDVGDDITVYSANITHNLSKMAIEAGIYRVLWRPDENRITKAHQLIEPLTTGLNVLESDPDRFKRFNAPNGWGTYPDLLIFVRNYLNACQQFPDADVSVWR